MMYKRTIYFILLVLVSLSSCMKDDELWDFDHLEVDISTGLFIVNEGNFTYGNASLSWYNPESGELINDAFFQVNGLPLGDVAHSMVIRDSLAYVVLNNSGRIYIFDTRSFEYKGKIIGLGSPRYMHFISEHKAYVTDLYARAISIVDPLRMEVTGSIDLSVPGGSFYQHPGEQMIQVGSLVYTNCWSFDNQVLIMDSERDLVVDSVRTIKQPNSMALDRNGSLWILCDGGFEGSPYGYQQPGLMKLEAGSTKAVVVHRFEPGTQPRALQINGGGDTLYFLNRDVFRMDIYSEAAPSRYIESPYSGNVGSGFYSLAIDPLSSEVYVGDAIDFVQRGQVFRYSSSGEVLDSLRVGIAPSYFSFN